MKNQRKIKYNNISNLLIISVILVLLNVLSNYVFFRLDLTAEKRYTLSDVTKDYLKNLDDIVFFKVYLDDDDLPPGFKRLRNSLKEMLDEFIVYGGENIQYEFINPNESKDEKKRKDIYKELYKRGLKPVTLHEQSNEGKSSQKIIFPGVLISYRDRELPLDLLSNNPLKTPEENLNNSVSELEYRLLNTINKLRIEYIPTIGFTTDHGELSNRNTYSLKKALSEFYNVKNVKIEENLTSLSERKQIDSSRVGIRNKFELLVIAKPTKPYSEKTKFILDQYLMHGGKIIWLIDGTNASMDSLAHKSFTMALANSINLDDMLFNYGCRVNPDLIQDINCAKIPARSAYAQAGAPQFVPFDWVYFPLLQANQKHPIGKNLDFIFSNFASSIDTVHPEPKVKKTVILSSSKYSKKLMVPIRVSLDILNIKPDKAFFNNPNLITGLLMEGEFRSNFANRIPEEIKNSPEIDFRETSKKTSMAVLSDGDIAYNPVKVTDGRAIPFPTGYDKYSGYAYANPDFILNLVNYMLDDSGIMYLRNREVKLRLLDKNKVKEQGLMWQIINTAVPVILIIIFGILASFIRKRKYTVKQNV